MQNTGFSASLLQISFVSSHRQLFNLFFLQFNELAILEYVLFESQKYISILQFYELTAFPLCKNTMKKKKRPVFSQMLTYSSKGAEMRWPMSYPDICHCLFMQALSPIQLSPCVLTSTSVKRGESIVPARCFFLYRERYLGNSPTPGNRSYGRG